MSRRKITEEPVKITPPIRQARFYCTPGLEPVGYKCNGIAIMREPKETLEELRSKCRNSVQWTTPDTVHCFIPLQNK